MPAPLQVLLLGPVEVRSDGVQLEVPGTRLTALLARLALAPGHVVTPATLIEALWGEQPPANAANALQSLVSRLRRVLPAGAVLSRPAGYELGAGPDAVDASRFERALAAAKAIPDAAGRLEALRSAEALWRGEPLAGLDDVPFVDAVARALVQARLAATEARLELQVGLGGAADAADEALRLAGEHPLRESLVAVAMRALAAAGRPADALGAYERLRVVLAEELGADPSPQVRDLHAAILRGDPALVPPALVPPALVPPPQALPQALPQPTTDPAAVVPQEAPACPEPPLAPPSRLRASLTSFVGREDDAARLTALLGEHRLVTLLGPGGAGKTRLALETARAAQAEGQAVHWVELAPLTASAEEVGQLAGAVLDDLGLRGVTLLDGRSESRGTDNLTRLTQALTGPNLLVLDNCEHLIAAAAALADELLARCPDLRVVATSREPLAILGEALHPVTPLRLPAVPDRPGETATDGVPEAVATSPAVRLFVDRATAASPGFVLDAATVPHVVEVCRRLDGLPLAIELAAARLRTLPVEQLAARLDQRFRLLTGGSRTAAPRHRTLRAVVEWSWDLLDERERDVAEHLAIFPAGATPDAVHAVLVGADPAADWSGTVVDDVTDLLLVLVDKSIVRAEPGQASLRLRMLETLREYGVERLDEREALAGARAAHARYFRDLAERCDPLLRTRDQVAALDTLHAERENLVAAMRHAVDSGDTDTAVRTASALSWFWMLTGAHSEGAQWLSVIDPMPGDAPEAPRAVVSIMKQILQLNAGGHDDAPIDEMLARLPPPGRYAHLTGNPIFALVDPVLAMLRGAHAESIELLDAASSHPDPWVRAMLRLLVASTAENAGEPALEQRSYELALGMFREIGDRWGIATCLSGLGRLQWLDGDHEAAARTYEDAVAILAEIRSRDELIETQLRLAGVRARLGDVEGSRRALDAAETAAEGWSRTFVVSMAALIRATTAWTAGDPAGAEAMLRDALERSTRAGMRPPQLRAVLRAALAGLLCLDRGAAASAEAEELLAVALEEAAMLWDMPCIATVAVSRAALALACGDPVGAARLLGVATAVRGREDRGDVVLQRTWDAVLVAVEAEVARAAHDEGAALSRRDAIVELGLTPRA